jgi:hypothetical protein
VTLVIERSGSGLVDFPTARNGLKRRFSSGRTLGSSISPGICEDKLSQLRLRIFDGSRELFSQPANFLVTITDGNQTQQVRNYFKVNEILFDLPFFDNFGDNYTVIVWAKGYKQAGFSPVFLSDEYEKILA